MSTSLRSQALLRTPFFLCSPSFSKRHAILTRRTTWRRLLHTEHVEVRAASSGGITVSLHDCARIPAQSPLIINLPAFPVQDIADVDSYLPRFLRRYPSATIHFRWPQYTPPSAPVDNEQHPASAQLRWPAALHDVLAGFDFLLHTMTPAFSTGANGLSELPRRDVYVYGSFLGAGLATSLALTESHTDKPMTVRGLLALNGVYNWTTFLPDHALNVKAREVQEKWGLDLAEEERRRGVVQDMGIFKALVPRLFQDPMSLFDPFASPVLFFHTAGLLVPPSFTQHWRPKYPFPRKNASIFTPSSSDDDVVAGKDPLDYVYSDKDDLQPPMPYPDDDDEDEDTTLSSKKKKPTRKGNLEFPPQDSTLRIPDTLLLHSTPPPLPDVPDTVVGATPRRKAWKQLKNAENSFASQASGLADHMRRGVFNEQEMRKWSGDESEDPREEAKRRVEIWDIGEQGLELGAEAEETARLWLEERLG